MSLFITILGVGAFAAILPARSASAACSVPSPSYGVATMQLNVDAAGDYRIWTHMYAPGESSNTVMLEIDGGNCHMVGDGGVQLQSWVWVNHQNGSASNYISETLSSGNHTVKLIGVEPSVKVDRILAVADESCIPSGSGDNCMITSDTTKPTVNITSPSDAETVSGTTTIEASATDDTRVARVEFYIQGNLVDTVASSPYKYNWDTTSYANATYTIMAKAYDAEGNNSSDSQALIINNEVANPPAVPTNLSAVASSYTTVDLSWSASANAAKYRVVRDGIVITTTTQVGYQDASAVAGTVYQYYVVAVDDEGNTSEPSDSVQVNTPTPPAGDTVAPTQPTSLSTTAESTNQINLSWSASLDDVGIKEYQIYRNSDEDPTFLQVATTSETTYGDGDVYDNTTFTYYIVAVDAAGNSSEPSGTSAATTPTLQSYKRSNVRGTIHNSDGRPVAGARVTVWVGSRRHQATTNWRGRYVINNIPSGRREISFRKHGYIKRSHYIDLHSGKTRWDDRRLRR